MITRIVIVPPQEVGLLARDQTGLGHEVADGPVGADDGFERLVVVAILDGDVALPVTLAVPDLDHAVEGGGVGRGRRRAGHDVGHDLVGDGVQLGGVAVGDGLVDRQTRACGAPVLVEEGQELGRGCRHEGRQVGVAVVAGVDRREAQELLDLVVAARLDAEEDVDDLEDRVRRVVVVATPQRVDDLHDRVVLLVLVLLGVACRRAGQLAVIDIAHFPIPFCSRIGEHRGQLRVTTGLR
jgi:hypothetical protein